MTNWKKCNETCSKILCQRNVHDLECVENVPQGMPNLNIWAAKRARTFIFNSINIQNNESGNNKLEKMHEYYLNGHSNQSHVAVWRFLFGATLLWWIDQTKQCEMEIDLQKRKNWMICAMCIAKIFCHIVFTSTNPVHRMWHGWVEIGFPFWCLGWDGYCSCERYHCCCAVQLCLYCFGLHPNLSHCDCHWFVVAVAAAGADGGGAVAAAVVWDSMNLDVLMMLKQLLCLGPWIASRTLSTATWKYHIL